MDRRMPEMDGYEACGEIQLRQAATERVPIVALTAHAPGEAGANAGQIPIPGRCLENIRVPLSD